MKKIILFFLLIIFLNPTNFNTIKAHINPLEKITIISKKAICQKDQINKNSYTFTYLGDVTITFSDKSKITCQKLQLDFESKKSTDTNTKTNNISNNLNNGLKNIILEQDITIKKDNKTITADKAQIDPVTKICILNNNVKIIQTKIKPKDIPLQTVCKKAILNMDSEHITLEGSDLEPVNTTIEISNYPSLLKKIKTKKEKEEERKTKKFKRKFI